MYEQARKVKMQILTRELTLSVVVSDNIINGEKIILGIDVL